MKKVLLLFGGNSSEHLVSCKSVMSIAKNIDKDLFDYELVGISKENDWYVFNDDLSFLENGNWIEGNVQKIENIVSYVKGFDVVFPMIHGTSGEDGKLQGMLELFEIPFVGCKTLSSAIGMDKEMSKIFFESLDIPQVPYMVVQEISDLDAIIKNIGFPMIVKPANGGSSIGIKKATTKEELVDALVEAQKYDKKVIVEKFIQARELECAILERDGSLICSKLGEIKAVNDFYDYDAKYVSTSITEIVLDLPNEILQEIQNYAKKIFNGLYCKGYSRIDFFYQENTGEVFINEINTIPGFTSISMYPELIKNEGITFKELITILIENA